MKHVVFLWVVLCSLPLFGAENVVVVFDDSGSMQGNRIKAAREALTEVVSTLPEGTNLGIVCINRGWICPLGPVNKQDASTRIASVHASGGTPLGRYMKMGGDSLLTLRSHEFYGNYRLLIVTDGVPDDMDEVNRYLDDIQIKGILVDVIGLDIGKTHPLATRVHSFREARDKESLSHAIQAVFAETTDATSGVESDYAMLSPMSDDSAMEAIKILTVVNNTPIGEKPPEPQGAGGQEVGQNSSSSGIRFGILIVVIALIAIPTGIAIKIMRS